jgi:hypothetical protein
MTLACPHERSDMPYSDQVGNRSLKGSDYGDGSGLNGQCRALYCSSHAANIRVHVDSHFMHQVL